jgi:hypothetical protein
MEDYMSFHYRSLRCATALVAVMAVAACETLPTAKMCRDGTCAIDEPPAATSHGHTR